MFEAGSQDVALRIAIKEYPANNKGLAIIPADDLPAPLPKATTAEATDENISESTETGAEASVENTTEDALQENDSEQSNSEKHI
jgi:hypothetical protein